MNNDLALCLKKVKADGKISGDDFHWMSDAQGAPVKMAVESVLADLQDQAHLKLTANQYVIHLNRSGQLRAALAKAA